MKSPMLFQAFKSWCLKNWKLLAFVLGSLAFVRVFSFYFMIGLNATESLNGTLFIVVKGSIPERGQLIAFWPPKNDFYNSSWFTKTVGGVGGDKVTTDGQSFFVNGNYIGNAKTKAKNGALLDAGPVGIVCPNCFFVFTTHPDSFDSRYEQIGWIPQSNVIGRAYRIF